MDTEGLTPENSVLCYVRIIPLLGDFDSVRYAQIDRKYRPCYLYCKYDEILFPPMEPGATFKAVNMLTTGNNVVYYFAQNINVATGLDITLPKKPGLYYAGAILSNGVPYTLDAINEQIEYLQSNGEKDAKLDAYKEFRKDLKKKENKILRKIEVEITKELLSKYKKTAWEPLIRARLEELNEKE